LTVAVLATACETSVDSLIGTGGNGGGAVTQAQATGNWSFTVRKTTTLPCTGGSLADGQILTAHLDVLTDGTVNGATSSWQNPPSGFFPLSGLVRFSDGSTDLTFSAGTGTGSAMELLGTISASNTFTGTLTDPAPGFSPMFSAGGCQYSTAGTKA
jgi:hypothetical protein